MEKNKVEELIAKYNEGLADPAEVRMIETLIESGEIELTQLRELTKLDEALAKLASPSPSLRVDDFFYDMLASEKKAQRASRFFFWSQGWSTFAPRLAFASILIVAGFVAGFFSKSTTAPTGEVQQLTREVSDLKEMMMLSLLEKESASERLKAVSLTSEMNEVSEKVTSALFQTLNNDTNVNVRLAALDALKAYVRNDSVRKQLVESIGRQDSPLVQLELAQLMASIQEKKSVTELKKLLDSKTTPDEVKSKIRKSIEVLI